MSVGPVTVPDLSEHLLSAEPTEQPVTRLLGQSPSGLSSTGESDVRNYYDMIAARQELDLRPQLERLDRLICWSEDIDESALSFAFRPLWQLDEPAKAALALSRAQATQVYAGLKLWPDATMARLAEAQLIADGTYPNASAVFAEAEANSASASPTLDYDPAQPRDLWGRWTTGSAGMSTPTAAAGTSSHMQGHAAPPPGSLSWLLNMLNPIGTAQAAGEPAEPPERRTAEPPEPSDLEPGEVMRVQRFNEASKALETIDPGSHAFEFLRKPGALPSEAEIARLEAAVRDGYIRRTCDFLRPDGKPIGERGTSSQIRTLGGGMSAELRLSGCWWNTGSIQQWVDGAFAIRCRNDHTASNHVDPRVTSC